MSKNKDDQSITLKTLTSDDIEDFMEWATDDLVTEHMMWDSYRSRNDAEDFFKNVVQNHPWFKAICLEGKVIGSLTLDKGKSPHACTAELGYVLARKFWGNGFASKAVNLAIKHGFEDLAIERIEAFVDPFNVASQKVLERNGFIQEGCLKNWIIQKGIVKDRLVYAVLRSLT